MYDNFDSNTSSQIHDKSRDRHITLPYVYFLHIYVLEQLFLFYLFVVVTVKTTLVKGGGKKRPLYTDRVSLSEYLTC